MRLKHRVTVRSGKPKLGLPLSSRVLIRRCVRALLTRENVAVPCEVNVLITDNDGIQTLNREFRQLDKPTDVLSFPARDRMAGQPLVAEEEEWSDGFCLLGDIAVSLPTAQAQAARYGHPITRELGFLTVHGTLHLLGYDHRDPAAEAEMQTRAEATLAALNLPPLREGPPSC